jgi:hypothetical protein
VLPRVRLVLDLLMSVYGLLVVLRVFLVFVRHP